MLCLVKNFSRILSESGSIKRNFSKKFSYSDEVILAKKNDEPIVALESTIITHGMPYPDNFDTAIKLEYIVRQRGACPATIGIIDGQIHVGLNPEQLKKLAKVSDASMNPPVKCSQRDISKIIVSRENAGTTVGATVTIANLAGISVMATGGIGGVHRGVEDTFDISSDLVVLGNTPVAVICAGVKAILDIPKTLEFLETMGVPVMTIGNEDTFPAFYSRKTVKSIKSPSKIMDSFQAAQCIKAQRDLKLNSGLIFAIPLPEHAALDPGEIEKFIDIAIRETKDKFITGKSVTPYLLERVTELTGGKSLAANKVLIENNAGMAADIAVQLSKLSLGSEKSFSTSMKNGKSLGSPVVIGGCTEDTLLQCEESFMRFDGRTHRGKNRKSIGGVGRNIAAALLALGVDGTKFLSVVGDDDAGRIIQRSLKSAGDTIDILSNEITARYTGIVDKQGECKFGFGEMNIFELINPNLIKKNYSKLEEARIIVLDGNSPIETIHEVIDIAVNCLVPVWYEPTDVKKACKIFDSHRDWKKVVQFISPNVKELIKIGEYFSINKDIDASKDLDVEVIKEIAGKLGEIIPVVFTTMGPNGLLVVRKSAKEDLFYPVNEKNKLSLIENCSEIQSRIYSPLLMVDDKLEEKKYSVSGCGDCLAAGIITGILRGLGEESCVDIGLKAAAISLESLESVPQTLSRLR